MFCQARCRHVCTGALQCTAVVSLEVDCGVMPFDLRRQLGKGKLVAFYMSSENSLLASCYFFPQKGYLLWLLIFLMIRIVWM